MTVDLTAVLAARQRALIAELEVGREAFEHPLAIGDSAEIDWEGALRSFLPKRYAVNRAFVMDAHGATSEQIDLVIHDAHFCPLLFEHGGHRYIPAESVYAAFEIKQKLDRNLILYAADKAATVRRLHRTNLPITHAGGEFPPRPLFRILAGILAYKSDWSPPFGGPFRSALADGPEPGRLDLGCAAVHGGFAATYAANGVAVETSGPDGSLMFFLLRLFASLQQLGSVPAIDLAAYSASLKEQ